MINKIISMITCSILLISSSVAGSPEFEQYKKETQVIIEHYRNELIKSVEQFQNYQREVDEQRINSQNQVANISSSTSEENSMIEGLEEHTKKIRQASIKIDKLIKQKSDLEINHNKEIEDKRQELDGKIKELENEKQQKLSLDLELKKSKNEILVNQEKFNQFQIELKEHNKVILENVNRDYNEKRDAILTVIKELRKKEIKAQKSLFQEIETLVGKI